MVISSLVNGFALFAKYLSLRLFNSAVFSIGNAIEYTLERFLLLNICFSGTVFNISQFSVIDFNFAALSLFKPVIVG